MNDRHEVEGYLKRLVIAEMRGGLLVAAQNDLNKLIIYGKNPDYLDMLHLLDQVVLSGSEPPSDKRCTTIIRFLETGVRHSDSQVTTGLALGVSDIDLEPASAPENEFVLEEFK